MLNIIKDNEGARNKYKRLGRGIGSGKGKTSARGGKGQTARSGVAINGFEGGQTPLERRLPKRGFKSLNTEIVEVLNFDMIEQFILSKKLSNKITIEDLRSTGLLKGRLARLKLLGGGELKSKISIQAHYVSKKAKDAAEKVGATIEIVKFSQPSKTEVKKDIKAPAEKAAAPKTEAKKAVPAKKTAAPKKVATKTTKTKETNKK